MCPVIISKSYIYINDPEYFYLQLFFFVVFSMIVLSARHSFQLDWIIRCPKRPRPGSLAEAASRDGLYLIIQFVPVVYLLLQQRERENTLARIQSSI